MTCDCPKIVDARGKTLMKRVQFATLAEAQKRQAELNGRLLLLLCSFRLHRPVSWYALQSRCIVRLLGDLIALGTLLAGVFGRSLGSAKDSLRSTIVVRRGATGR